VCAVFFATVPLTVQELRNTMICLIGPIVGIAILGIQVLEEKNITFQDVSNAAAAGRLRAEPGRGILGLGMLAILVYLTLGATSKLMLGSMLALFVLMLRQCILTFSRGGLYMMVGSAIAGGFFLVRDKKQRKRLFLLVSVLAIVLVAWLIPRVEK
jgi:hypothetical protein